MDATANEIDTPPPTPPSVASVVREQALANRKARHEADYPIAIERVDAAIADAVKDGQMYALLVSDLDLEVCERLQAHYEGQGFRVSFVPGGTYPSPGAYFRVNF